ncbi:PadR family transcriptional regulator, partial [Dactylosporangium siamense]
MVAELRMTAAVATVVSAFLADPAADRYGLDLMRVTGHSSGTLYPILLRLRRAGWVVARWEDADPAAPGRPARRCYRLTPDGVVVARTAVAELAARLARGVDPAATFDWAFRFDPAVTSDRS